LESRAAFEAFQRVAQPEWNRPCAAGFVIELAKASA
jgi:hypothetical protein